MKFDGLLRERKPERWLLMLCIYMYAGLCVVYMMSDFAGLELLVQYGQIPVLAAMGSCLCRGAYFQRRRYLLALVFILWTYCCCWLRLEINLTQSSRWEAARWLLLCGVAFPFAFLTGDKDRSLLDKLLLPVLSGLAVLYWLAFWGLLRGQTLVIIPQWMEFGATYSSSGRVMLRLLNIYHYCAGYLAAVCFYASLYLAARHRKRPLLVAWLLVLLATFAGGVLITYSRTAVFTVTAVAVYALHLLLQKLQLRPWQKWGILFLGAVTVVVLTALLLNRIYDAVNSIRNIWYGLWNLTDRTEIWSGGLRLLKEEPLTLLRGYAPDKLMGVIDSYLPRLAPLQHIHSGYLQTLLRTGLPGLAFVAALVVGLVRSAGTVLRSPEAHVEDKLLLCLPFACLAMAILESIIFFTAVNTETLNLLMLLFSGYVFEKAQELKS